MDSLALFQNPKRVPSLKKSKSSWYDYYAGYSPDFVQDVRDHVLNNKDDNECIE